MEKIRDLLKVNQNGTTAYHIVEGAKKIGFEATGVKCNIDDLNEDNIVLPCIANVIINNTYRHFVVIYKIDFMRKTLLIADPSNKIMKMSFDIFKSIFSGVIIMLYPKDDIPKEQNKNLKIKLLNHFIQKHPKLIKQISILSLFITIFSISSSFYLEKISDALNIYKNSEIVVLIFLIFLMLTILKSFTTFFRQKILVLINEKINLELTLDTFKNVLSLPYKNYRNKTTGDIITRILDMSSLKDNISKIFLTLIIDLPLALIAFSFLFMINDKLCLLSIIILILYVIIIFLFKDFFDSFIKQIKNNNVDATNYMIESVNNFETVKGLKIGEKIYQQFEKKFVKLLKSTFKYDNLIALQCLLKDLVYDSGLVLIYGVGAILVVKEQMTFGNLLSFGMLLSYFFEPIKNLVSLESNIRDVDLILKRAYEIDVLENNNGIIDEFCKGEIKFNELNYSYDDRQLILKDLNLTIKSGNKVLILGSSGSGKSTILKIIMKYYNVDRNKLYINDIDINDYKAVKGIKYISQSENLFTDSLYNNITLYRNVNVKKLMEVADICKIDKIIKDNPLGYNMLIEDNGFNLSGGERQRIVLARTILDKFNVLLIDEGLNQMDIDLERIILKQMFARYKDKTIIVVSHRLENSDLYDQRLILENGVLIENVSKT